MKRGMLILLFIFILAYSVSAMTVTLVSPTPDGIEFQNVNSKDVSCKVVKNETEEITSLTVWYGENETLGWQADSTENNPADDTPISFSLTNLINATYTWNCLALNNESNAQFADSNLTFKITFTTAAPNTAPSWQQSTNQSTTEDSGTTLVINLDYDSSDTEDDAASQNMTYSISESASSIIDCSVSGADMRCGPPAANQSGDNTVTVTATDSGGLTASIDYNISVMPVNDAPYLSTMIPNQTWSQDKNKTIDLDNYFSDVDDSSLNYTYTFTSTGTINIDVIIELGGDAVFTPDSDWTGTETLTFTATDSGGLSITSNEVILTVEEANVTEENNPPNIDSYTPEANPTISVGESQVFSITKSDPDGDAMNVTWYVDHVIQEGETGDSFTYTASSIGSFIIKVSVSDGLASDSNTWTLTVQAAGAIANRTAAPGEEGLEEKVSACGDGNCSEDETQLGCCKDCGCPDGYTCEDDKCRKEKKAGNIILLIVVLGLFACGAGAGIYYYKKKQEKEIFGLAKTPFEAPPKEAPKEKIEVKEVKPVTKPEKKPLKKVKTTSQVLLKQYMIYNLRKGKSFEQVKKELLKVGWTEEQVQDAYTAAQLDEAFS